MDRDKEVCEHCDLGNTYYCPEYIPSEGSEMSGISKDTFQDMSVDSKLCVLFDYMQEIQHAQPKRVRDRDLKCEKRQSECNVRFKKIENAAAKHKVWNTAASFIGGFVGGWSAVWASFKLSLFQ